MRSDRRLPIGWHEARIGDVAEVVTGGTPDRGKPQYWGGNIPWMSSGEIHQRRVKTTAETITGDGLSNSNARMLPVETVMVALNGQGKTRGTTAILGRPVTCNQSLAGIIVDHNQLLPFFAFYYLETQYQALRGLTGDEGRNGLNLGLIRNLTIPLPPLKQQRRIVEILDTMDDVIEATWAVIEQTRRLKAALLQDLLTNGLPGRRREFKSTRHLANIPADWQILSLEQIGDGKRPALRTGPFGSSLKTEHFTTSGRPVLTIGSLGEGEILTDELFYVDEAKARELSEYEVEPGDVVFSRVADVGRSVTIPEGAGGWIISSNLMRIAVDRSRFDSWFLRQLLVHSQHLKNQIRRLTADAGREIVNSEVLSGILFPMPGRDEQDQIAEVIRRVDQRIWGERDVLSQLVKTKSALSQGLLTGRILVTKSGRGVS